MSRRVVLVRGAMVAVGAAGLLLAEVGVAAAAGPSTTDLSTATSPQAYTYTVDGGAAQTPVVQNQSVYSYLTDPVNGQQTSYLGDIENAADNNAHTSGRVYVFKTTFTVPAGATSRALSGQIYADDAATVLLNGTPIGSVGSSGAGDGFRGTPGTLSGTPTTGVNTLEIDLNNFYNSSQGENPFGIDIAATETYTEAAPAPALPEVPYAPLLAVAALPAGAIVIRRQRRRG